MSASQLRYVTPKGLPWDRKADAPRFSMSHDDSTCCSAEQSKCIRPLAAAPPPGFKQLARVIEAWEPALLVQTVIAMPRVAAA